LRGQAVTGYFGKVPAHGDFVTRRLPDAPVAAWDAWLQACIAASRAQLGEKWLDHYLTSPVWRFAIAPGVLAPEGLAGVMMPSVDRAGRYFPLMLGATGAPPPLDWFHRQGAWFDAIENLAREALETGFTLAQLDAAPEPARGPDPGIALALRLPLDADIDARIDAHIAVTALHGYTLWWSEGSPRVDASLLVCSGMPQPSAFAALLDGQWTAAGWDGVRTA
jgi:type VI secretion system protein ImpM